MPTPRPEPPDWGPPPGTHWVCEEEGDDWRLCTTPGRKCRQPRCPNPAVAELARRVYLYKQNRAVVRWWACCDTTPGHFYGRWIEDGKIMGWRLEKDAEDLRP